MFKPLAASAAVCVSMLSLAAQAQDVFVLPGPNSASSTVVPFQPQFIPFGSGFTAGSGAFQVFAKPDGTEYYVVSASANQTVTSVDPGFQSPKSLGNLGAAATASALTADGKYLLVVAGGALFIYSTATDTLVSNAGITPAGGPIIDLALSLDGSQAFVLSSTTNAAGDAVGTLYSMAPSSGQVRNTLVLTNIVNGVSVGPNDLVYVGAVNRLYEINPATLAFTANGQIALNASAGKPGFTPDGRYALVPNESPGTNAASLVLVDLIAHDLAASSANLGLSTISSIIVPSASVAFGYAANTQSVFEFTIPSLTYSAINFEGVPTLNITAQALSLEVQEGSNATPAPTGGSPTTARYLYLVASGNIYRVDLTTNSLAGQNTVSIISPEAISVARPAITGQSPVTLLIYGNKQNVALGGVSEPLVVRALDGNGNGLSGVPVTFASSTAGVQIQNPNVTTGANGYAVTTISSPSAFAQIGVTATAGAQIAIFSLTAGTSTGGGGSTGTQAGSLTIVSGQGQVLLAGFATSTGNGQPLTVLATDENNKPQSGVTVTFAPSSSNTNPGAAGGISGVSAGTDGGPTDNGYGRIVTTGANGLAGVNFLANSTGAINFDLTEATFVASSPNVNSVTFYETVVPSTLSPTAMSSPGPTTTLTGQSGATLTGAITITIVTEEGTPIPDVLIQAVAYAPSTGQTGPAGGIQTITASPVATCLDTTGNGVLTNQHGQAVCDLVIKAPAATLPYQFSIEVGDYIAQGPFNLVVTPGAPTTVKMISANNLSGAPGQPLASPFVVEVDDAGGNPLVGQPITFQPQPSSSLVLSDVSATTNTVGRASAQGTLGPTSGTYTLLVTAGGSGGPSTTFTYTITVPVTGIQPVSGNIQTTQVDTAFTSPLVVQVNNASGPVAGVTVTFSASNGATLSTYSATTDTNGQASTTVTAGPTPGAITVIANTTGGFSATFSLTAIPAGPSNVTFLNGASFQKGISPGGIAVLEGTNLLPGFSGLYNALDVVGPLPTSFTSGVLQGLSVTFNGVAAPIYYASNQNGQEQVAVQVPYGTPTGTVGVVIDTPGGGTGTFNTPVQAAAPGVFQTQYNGANFAVAVRQSDGSYISPSNPAKIGDVVCVFATGLGQTTPALDTNSVGVAGATLVYSINAGLNNAGVRLASAGPSLDEVGVFSVCMEVPAGTATGSRQPVGIVVHTTPGVSSGDFFGNSTYIPIQ